MKPLFFGLTILAAGAGSFFSYQLKEKYTAEQKVESDAKDDTTKTKKASDVMQENLDKELNRLKNAKDKQAELEASNDSLTANQASLKSAITNLNRKLEEEKEKFAELQRVQQQVAELIKSIGGGGDVTPENLPDKVKELQAKRDALQKELDELLTTVEGAKKNVADNKDNVSRMSEHEAERAARFRHNSMESVVTAVDPDWGFVVIGAGSNTGFTPQTKLIIERNGHMIGEVKPSAIEASQTIAEIDADSMSPGARIQPGDRVILSEPATN